MTTNRKLAALLGGVALALGQGAAHAGWVTVSSSGSPVLSACNPKINLDMPQETQDPTVTTCRVDGLPGSAALPGFILRASRSAPIIINSVSVGTLYDRVWCQGVGTVCDATSTYILGLRVNLNTNVWNPSGNSFEINDLFRAIRAAVPVDIAYFTGTVDNGTAADTARAYKDLEYAGRTLQGLFEPAGSSQTELNKVRNNGWVNFRTDANANDPDSSPPYSVSSAWSPWVLVRQVCSAGFNPTAQPLKLRLWEGGEEGQTPQPILTSGYACN